MDISVALCSITTAKVAEKGLHIAVSFRLEVVVGSKQERCYFLSAYTWVVEQVRQTWQPPNQGLLPEGCL